jgi:hypothetical protein
MRLDASTTDLVATHQADSDVHIEAALQSGDEECFERGLEKLPADIRATILNITELDEDWQDPSNRGPDQYRSCFEVANAATAQEEPRVEAAAVWAQTNFECQNGTRQWEAVIHFHRHCCAHAFSSYTPPERSNSGQQLLNLQPGAKDPSDMEMIKGLLTGVASVMSENHKQTLTSANRGQKRRRTWK